MPVFKPKVCFVLAVGILKALSLQIVYPSSFSLFLFVNTCLVPVSSSVGGSAHALYLMFLCVSASCSVSDCCPAYVSMCRYYYIVHAILLHMLHSLNGF